MMIMIYYACFVLWNAVVFFLCIVGCSFVFSFFWYNDDDTTRMDVDGGVTTYTLVWDNEYIFRIEAVLACLLLYVSKVVNKYDTRNIVLFPFTCKTLACWK